MAAGIEINFARIDAADDVDEILSELRADAAASEAQPDETPSSEATQRVADALGLTAGDLAERRGADFTPLEALAVEHLLALSGNPLLEAARKAAATGAAPGALYVFRRMLAIHFAVEAVVSGDAAEADRALQAWGFPFGNGHEQVANIRAGLERAGGAAVATLLARRFLALARSGADTAVLNQAVRQAAFATDVEDVRAVWIDGLLAAPAEILAQSAEALDQRIRESAEAGLAGRIARQVGAQGAATDDAAALLFALVGGLADAFAVAGPDIAGVAADADRDAGDARFDLDRGGGPLRAVDLIAHVLDLAAKLKDTPGGVLKMFGYRMTLRAEAYRRGAAGDGPVGPATARLMTDPPADLHLGEIDTDAYAALADPKATTSLTLRRIRDAGGASDALLFLIPLLQEPEAVGRFGFEGTRLAPLAARWRGDVAAGGGRRDLALARAATGAAILAIAAFSNLAVADASLADPVDQLAAFVATCNAALGGGEIDPDDVPQWSRALAGAVLAVAQLAAGRAFLRRFAERVAASPGADAAAPEETSPLPEGTLLRAAADEIARLAARMTARRDLWGDAHDTERSAIDDEMLRHGADATPIGKQTDFAGTAISFRDWPAAYEEYRRLAGNGLRHPEHGQGAKEFLDAVVSGKSPMSTAYRRMSDGPQGSKAVFIRHTIGSYRRLAQQQILGDRRFRDFAVYVQRAKAPKGNAPHSGEA